MTDQEKLKAAIDTVARHFVHAAVSTAIAWDRPGWEAYAELGEHDFEMIVLRASQLADSIQFSGEAYKAAYGHLAERATGEPV